MHVMTILPHHTSNKLGGGLIHLILELQETTSFSTFPSHGPWRHKIQAGLKGKGVFHYTLKLGPSLCLSCRLSGVWC
jgi:hypothetical protein